MDTIPLKLDRAEARERYRDYLKHLHWSAPIDDEIRRCYHLLANGRLIIQALESVKAAGLGDDGFPKLALARADQKTQGAVMRSDGSATFSPMAWRRSRETRLSFDWPPGSFSGPRARAWRAEAIVPLIPLNLRPKRGLENYHVLWEALWSRAVPHDPILLRRLGKGDLWLVVAQWDLTEVERAALQARVNAA
jgi:hypothetical protein